MGLGLIKLQRSYEIQELHSQETLLLAPSRFLLGVWSTVLIMQFPKRIFLKHKQI